MINPNKTEQYSIVQVAPPQNVESGDYFYRVESPGRAFSRLDTVRTVVDITNIHRQKDALMHDADILIVHHVCDPDLLPLLVERKNKGLINVFEIWDNIDDIQPWNLTYQFWKNRENRALMYKLMSVCDALQANNPELLNRFGHLNDKYAIFPNHIGEISSKMEKKQHDSLTIGWGGSYGHLEDLQWIVSTLVSWFMDHRDTKIAIMGSEDIFNLFADIPFEQKIYRKPGSISKYYDFLDTIDIGLAPLKDTPYNRCRSDVKFVEYAAHGVIPVLQDLVPYQNANIPAETKCLFADPKQLVDVLDELVAKSELRQKVAEKAFEHIKHHRLEEQHSAERFEFYANLFRGAGKPVRKSDPFETFTGYVPYTETDFERNLYNGLIYSETRNMPEEAIKCFKKAESLAPDHYLPNLFMFKCVNNPKEELRKALQKNPLSLKGYLLLGEIYNRESRFEAALKTYREAIKIFPDYDVPYFRCAGILGQLGMSEQAQELQRLGAQINPWQSESKKVPHDGVVAGSGSRKLYLIMPRGNNFGWGVCGKYLARELSNLTHVKYITETFTVEQIGDELDYRLLKDLLASKEDLDRLQSLEGTGSNIEPVIQAIRGNDLQPWGQRINSSKKIGYTFFEDNILSDNWIKDAKEYFNVIVAGSKWCEEILQEHGLQNTKTIIQGIDPALFNPHYNEKEYFKDKFVIFSGGKFELRKGQDLVIRAFRHLQQKYKDVLLITSWYNIWQHSLQTMESSPYIKFKADEENYNAFMNSLLAMNGISLESVITLPSKANIAMSKIYKNTDIGLFPNRCEGGTNLVLMEYMACGKPAIASFSSGHRDILTEKNALLIKSMKSMTIQRHGNVVAHWDDPDLDEIIDKLEWAYLHRDRLDEIGWNAGEDLAKKTWKESARQFYKLAMDMGE
jgi:glycosyltransferase involved in cell wall biosynthesis